MSHSLSKSDGCVQLCMLTMRVSVCTCTFVFVPAILTVASNSVRLLFSDMSYCGLSRQWSHVEVFQCKVFLTPSFISAADGSLKTSDSENFLSRITESLKPSVYTHYQSRRGNSWLKWDFCALLSLVILQLD